MKTLTSSSWKIEGEEQITIDFDAYQEEVSMEIHQANKVIHFDKEQLEELKDILSNTVYIFDQFKK